MTVEEFREILEDVSSHFQLLEPMDLETFSFHLLNLLEGSGALKGRDRDEYVRAIYDFLYDQFPDYYRALLFGAPWS